MSVLARLDDLRAACTSRRAVARGVFNKLLHEEFFAINPQTIEAMVAAASFHPYAYMHVMGERAPDHLVRTSDREMNGWADVYSALKTRVHEAEYVSYCATLRPTVVQLMDTITLAQEQLGNPFSTYYDQPRRLAATTIQSLLRDDIARRQAVARGARSSEITLAVRILLEQGRRWQEYAHQEVPTHFRQMYAFEHEQWRALKQRRAESTEPLYAVLALQSEALTNPLVQHYRCWPVASSHNATPA